MGMEEQKREFVGGIDKVTPENIYKREQANSPSYQSHDIFGLNGDYINQLSGPYGFIELYKSVPREKKEKFLNMALDSVSKMKTYDKHYKKDKTLWNENSPAVFAEDVLPYIQAIDEMVLDMKATALEIKNIPHQDGITRETNRLVDILFERAEMIIEIIRSETDKYVRKYSSDNDLQTDIFTLSQVEKKYSKPEALELIQKRIEYAKKLLKTGPLPGSFSYLRKDGNVTPVDWEPTDEKRKKLAEQPKKIR
ncbi:MAG: hypothetical protein Q7S08_01900 [bacterium]|nr:hypothetical protein [bacterium]